MGEREFDKGVDLELLLEGVKLEKKFTDSVRTGLLKDCMKEQGERLANKLVMEIASGGCSKVDPNDLLTVALLLGFSGDPDWDWSTKGSGSGTLR